MDAFCILQKEYSDLYIKRRRKLFPPGTQMVRWITCNTLEITDTSYKNVKRNLQVIRKCVSTLVLLAPLKVIY